MLYLEDGATVPINFIMSFAIVGEESVMIGLSQLSLELMSQDLGRWKYTIIFTHNPRSLLLPGQILIQLFCHV